MARDRIPWHPGCYSLARSSRLLSTKLDDSTGREAENASRLSLVTRTISQFRGVGVLDVVEALGPNSKAVAVDSINRGRGNERNSNENRWSLDSSARREPANWDRRFWRSAWYGAHTSPGRSRTSPRTPVQPSTSGWRKTRTRSPISSRATGRGRSFSVIRYLPTSAFLARIYALSKPSLRITAKARQRTLVLVLTLMMGALPGSAAWAGAGFPYSAAGDFLILESGWAPQIATTTELLIGSQAANALLRHWSVSLLQRSLITETTPNRPQVAVALMEVGDAAGIVATTEIVRHGDYVSRMITVQRLAEGGPRGVGFLASQCVQQPAFADLMLESLIRFDDRAPVACLVPALGSKQLDTRLLANVALSQMGDASSVPRMHWLWHRAVDPAERGILAGALFALGDRVLLAQVRHDLASGETVDSRRFAALALGQLNESAVRADLAKALDDSAIAVRLAAAASLSRLGDRRGLELLARAVDDPGAYPHWLLETYMDQIDVHVAWDPILRAAHSPDIDLRIAAVQAIASRHDPLSEQTLLDLLAAERDSSVRAYILSSLGRTGSPRTITAVSALLTDRSPSVRSEAAICLLRSLPGPVAH